MPRGDGSGPAGLGPMTGRGAGYCAGYPVPGFANWPAGVGAWGRGPYAAVPVYGQGAYQVPAAFGPYSAPYQGVPVAATPGGFWGRPPVGGFGQGSGRWFGWGQGWGRGGGRGGRGRGRWR